MKLTVFTDSEIVDMVRYLKFKRFPEDVNDVVSRKNFNKRSKRFIIDSDNESRILFCKRNLIKLKVFSINKEEFKILYFKNFHDNSGHSARDKLGSVIKDKAYNCSRSTIVNVLKRYPQCRSRNLMNTRPEIIPIRAYFYRKIFIFDSVDLSGIKISMKITNSCWSKLIVSLNTVGLRL